MVLYKFGKYFTRALENFKFCLILSKCTYKSAKKSHAPLKLFHVSRFLHKGQNKVPINQLCLQDNPKFNQETAQ